MKDNATWDDFDGIPESEADVTPQGSKQERIIAEDEFYKLTARRLEIKNYFYPTKKSRFINVSDIKFVYYKNQEKTMIVSQVWGMNGTNVWWAQDQKRPWRGTDYPTFYNIVVDNEERTMKGFTVSDFEKFRNGMEQVATQISYIRDQLPDLAFSTILGPNF